MRTKLPPLTLPDKTTYIAAFLTFKCSFACSYCINKINKLKHRKEMTAEQWIKALNRLDIKRENMLPVTIQGGEPSRHDGFLDIIKGINKELYVDLLTNLDFDIENFMHEIPADRLKRDVPYASIRVSYQTEFSQLNNLVGKIAHMQNNGYSIGLYSVLHPKVDIKKVTEKSSAAGIDFRTKDFLGKYEGEVYGKYRYEDACFDENKKTVFCRSYELLIAPDGNVHRCHRDLYAGENPVGNILDPEFKFNPEYSQCSNFGECNPCDIKLKTNRFQQSGHCAVEILNHEEELLPVGDEIPFKKAR